MLREWIGVIRSRAGVERGRTPFSRLLASLLSALSPCLREGTYSSPKSGFLGMLIFSI